MVLTDLLNKLPMKVASEIAKETGKSKYSLAQVCNSVAAVPGIFVAMDAYHNNEMSAVLAGSGAALLNISYTFYNQKRKLQEDPSFIEKEIEEIAKKDACVNRPHLRSELEGRLFALDNAEQRLKVSGLYYSIIGVALATLSYLAYSTLGE